MLGSLQLLSEKCPPTGGFAGSSVEKLLTQTSLRLPGLLLREAIQNSLDAALPGKNPIQFDMSLRRLTREQSDFLRDSLVPQARKAGFESVYSEVDWSADPGPYVLELSDFGTRGLGGGIDPRVAPLADERTDFVDFVFKIGKTKDMRQVVGGGTFGFGKASSYMMSRAHTVVVHTATEFDGELEERLIVITLGKQFSQSRVMYTGRHWFGRLVPDAEGVIEPLVGREAALAASALGLPDRKGRSGTTLCILAPRLESVGDDGSPDPARLGSLESRFVAALEEAVHFWCWPLLLKHKLARHPSVQFGLHVNGKDESGRLKLRDGFFGSLLTQYHRILSHTGDKSSTDTGVLVSGSVPVSEAPPLGLRVNLGPSYSRKTVDVQLGRVSVEAYVGPVPRFNTGWQDALLPEPVGHIALMRPIGTVVCYRAVRMRGGSAPQVPFLGICLASDHVHGLIADSEPPTHDDWNPENVERPVGQRLVRRFLREIDEVAKRRFDSSPAGSAAPPTPVGVGVSNFLGGLIGGEGRRSTAPTPPQVGTTSGAKGAKPVVTSHTLEVVDGCRHVVFRVRRPRLDEGGSWRARPQIVIDGKSQVDAEEGFRDPPEVLGWEDAEGRLICASDSLPSDARAGLAGNEVRVRLRLPRAYVIALKIDSQEALSDGAPTDLQAGTTP